MLNIALDGPAGAGKSTIAKMVAKRLNILYLDTGAMYRALGLKAIDNGIDPTDRVAVVDKIINTTDIGITFDGISQHTWLDGRDVTEYIRTPDISKAASDISAIPEIRVSMVEKQRKIAESTDMILDGRDIGTFVLPNTKLKFFLTADVSERADRRWRELQGKGTICTYDTVLKEMIERDRNDTERNFAPLKRADDAILIDSTRLSIDEVADIIIEKAKAVK